MAVVRHAGALDGVGKLPATGQSVQVVPGAISASSSDIQQADFLTGPAALTPFGHQCGQPQLPRRKQHHAPAFGGLRGAVAACSGLAGAVGYGIDHCTNLTRVCLTNFVQRQQRVIALAGDSFQAVAGGAPSALEVFPVPPYLGTSQNGGTLAGAGVAHNVKSTTLALNMKQQRAGQ